MARSAEKTTSDVVLIDIRQQEVTGFALARRYRALDTNAALILLIDTDLPQYRDAVAACGASAFVLRQSIAGELIRLLTVIEEQRTDPARNP